MAKDLCLLTIGVDEAGRGPILGDLVIGLVVLDKKKEKILSEYGVRDSKELTPVRRKSLVKHIIDNSLIIATGYIPPLTVDKHRLNKLVASNMSHLINMVLTILDKVVTSKCNVEIYVDEVKGFEQVIKRSIGKYVNLDIVLKMEQGADKKYVVVSAASIIAKFYRDENLYSAKKLYGEFGSGYPTDKRTRDWIRDYYSTYREPPPIVRRSWNTLLALAPQWYRDLKKGRSILDYLGGRG